MMAIRTTPVEVGTSPYNWNTQYKYQCTWYAYYRCGEKGLPYPCWYSGSGNDGYGSYTDAKKWLDHYRSPWVVYPKDSGYIPVENDIVVFDGQFGHVAFIEKVTGNLALLSQYKSGDKDSFSNYNWQIGTNYTGNLLGYLHCPISILEPVERNAEVDQIQTTDDQLRIRTKPNLSGEIIGHVQLGYYNVLSRKDAITSDKVEVDGLTCWYEISKGKWCANITTNYLPSSHDSDIIRQIEEYFNKMKTEVSNLTSENQKYKSGIEEMISIGEKLIK